MAPINPALESAAKTLNSNTTLRWAAAVGCACSGILLAPAGALVLNLEHLAFLGELNGGGGRGREELK